MTIPHSAAQTIENNVIASRAAAWQSVPPGAGAPSAMGANTFPRGEGGFSFLPRVRAKRKRRKRNAGSKLPACARFRLRNGLPFSRSDGITANQIIARIPHQSAARSSHADSFISALRAGFAGCAPKRACGRSPREKLQALPRRCITFGTFYFGKSYREIATHLRPRNDTVVGGVCH